MTDASRAGPPARRIQRLARDTFGFERLRAGQEDAIRSVASGRDTLAVLPTGWGKSAIYQLAALLIPGPTVVVSPLIALQRDQVQALLTNEVTAAETNSQVPKGERDDAFSRLAAGDLEFLFLAPEQLANEEVLRQAAVAEPSLLVVDEAHCISAWGHDFRPDYLRLAEVAEGLGRPPILALTATAAPPVRAEIVERLGLRDPNVVVRGFAPGHRVDLRRREVAGGRGHHRLGMGIDTASVRFVYHHDVADSLDSYYQEIGRAGRDGAPAAAVLFYRPEDLGLRRFFASGAQVDVDQAVEPEVAAEQVVAAQDARRRVEQSRVDMMRAYAESRGCRRRLLLGYFGEALEDRCGNCDRCLDGAAGDEDGRAAASPFPLHSWVSHQAWGRGQVMDSSDGRLVVFFETAGYKTLDLDLVLRRGLLSPED